MEIVDLAAAREARNKNNKEKKMNSQATPPVNKQDPANFRVVTTDGENHDIDGYIGLYSDFVIFGDEDGNVKKVFNKDSWYTIDNVTPITAMESEAPVSSDLDNEEN